MATLPTAGFNNTLDAGRLAVANAPPPPPAPPSWPPGDPWPPKNWFYDPNAQGGKGAWAIDQSKNSNGQSITPPPGTPPETLVPVDAKGNLLTSGPTVDRQAQILPDGSITHGARVATDGPNASIVPDSQNPYGTLLNGAAATFGLPTLDQIGNTIGLGGPGSGSGGGAASIDTGAISGAAAKAGALSDQFNNQYLNFQPKAAPTATAYQIAQTQLAQQQAQIQAGQSPTYSANADFAAQQGRLGTYQIGELPTNGQDAIRALQVQAAIAAKTAPVQADLIHNPAYAATQNAIYSPQVAAQLADRTRLGATSLLDPTQQAQFRAQQQGLVSGLNGAIAGTDPSVAAIMLRQATDRNIANQYALASAATGQNTGLAERQAMINAGDANQTSIGQQALLRAQEIATARGQLGSVLDQGRASDINMANANAGFQNTANLTQAQLDAANASFNAQQGNQVNLANAGNTLQAGTTTAQLTQQINLANQAAQNQTLQANQQATMQAGTTNATLAQQIALANQASQNQVGLANAGNSLQAATTNTTLAQQVALANAAAKQQSDLANQQNFLQTGTLNNTLAQQVNLANAAAGTQTSQQNAQMANQVGIANAGNVTSANTASSQLANQVALANAAAQNQTNTTNAQLGTQTSIANAGNATTTNAQNITAQNDLAQNALTGSGQQITGTVGAAQAQATAQQSANQLQAAKVGTYGAIAGQIVSDRRAKTDITDASPDMGEFMNAIKASGWRYKDPSEPGAADGEHFGPMAQDLEKSRVGRTLVKDTPGGRKMVDPQRAAMVALAALSELNKRVSKVEAR